jgi:isoquinoline 1-oxidoreductase subunit alpha
MFSVHDANGLFVDDPPPVERGLRRGISPRVNGSQRESERLKKGGFMKSIVFNVNGQSVTVEAEPEKPLLWVLREDLGLTGAKYGCGMALCGCCTVHLNGDAIRSCVTPVARAEGKTVITIEGLSRDLSHPVQQAWLEIQVPQCGYCQPGQMMSAACLLAEKANPTDPDIDDAMSGNLCRCGTYPRIRRAIHRAAEIAAGKGGRK